MILNVKFPPIDGYDSAAEAIAASKAKSAEFQWFDPKLAEGQTIEAVAVGSDWFALRLSNGLRTTVRAAGSIIEASLDSEPLPASQTFTEEVEIHSVGVNGPYHYTWRPQEVAVSMIGHRIVFVTFHPHRLILVTPRDICAWFWLMHEVESGKPRLKWTFGPD
jgi:hypothetical protein